MNAINEKLEQREKEGRPVKVGLIGAGQMATALGQGLVKAGLVEAGLPVAKVELQERLAGSGRFAAGDRIGGAGNHTRFGGRAL